MLLIATLRSTVAFFLLFFTLDMAFLLLGIGYLNRDAAGAPNPPIIIAGGVFGILAAFLAWYNALAGILDTSNRCVILLAYRAWIPQLVTATDIIYQFLHHSRCSLPMVRDWKGEAEQAEGRACQRLD